MNLVFNAHSTVPVSQEGGQVSSPTAGPAEGREGERGLGEGTEGREGFGEGREVRREGDRQAGWFPVWKGGGYVLLGRRSISLASPEALSHVPHHCVR